MVKKRLIPVLLLKDGQLVRSERFSVHQVIGGPLHEAKRFNDWNVDELVYLALTDTPLFVLDAVAETCFMPLTWGGGLKSVEQMREVIARGADKIVINSQAFRTPGLITEAAKAFGSQAIVVSIDSKDRHVVIDGGRTPTGRPVLDWAIEAEQRGAGEILLQCVERDGTGEGYDLDLISQLSHALRIPLIACSGAGTYDDFAAAIKAGAAAAAAANIFHFKELADRNAKRAMHRHGIDVRL